LAVRRPPALPSPGPSFQSCWPRPCLPRNCCPAENCGKSPRFKTPSHTFFGAWRPFRKEPFLACRAAVPQRSRSSRRCVSLARPGVVHGLPGNGHGGTSPRPPRAKPANNFLDLSLATLFYGLRHLPPGGATPVPTPVRPMGSRTVDEEVV